MSKNSPCHTNCVTWEQIIAYSENKQTHFETKSRIWIKWELSLIYKANNNITIILVKGSAYISSGCISCEWVSYLLWGSVVGC